MRETPRGRGEAPSHAAVPAVTSQVANRVPHILFVSWVFLFWVAFVLTRPFGATFGDLLTKPKEAGGLDFGTYGASAVFAAILAVALWREARDEAAPAAHP